MHLTQNKTIYTLSVFLGSILVLMFIGMATGRSQEDVKTQESSARYYVDNFCFDGKIKKMSVQNLVNTYTERTNDYFNNEIEYIMTNKNLSFDEWSPSLNDYDTTGGNLCKNSEKGLMTDMTCQYIAVCNSDSAPSELKSHPLCLAVTLTGIAPNRFGNYNFEQLKKIEPLKYSYFCYKAALELKQDDIFDSTPQSQLSKCGTEFADKEICDLQQAIKNEQNETKKQKLQIQLENTLSGRNWWGERGKAQLSSATASIIDLTGATTKRVQFINEEIVRAKTALDQTLDTYTQMRAAWKMHTHYVNIFSKLVKYRDHLVDVRKQTELFPFRFVDATTTQCL